MANLEIDNNHPVCYKSKDYFYKENVFQYDKFDLLNSELHKQKLDFGALDVKYIIVEKESDINELAEFIKELKVYIDQEKYRLISKIISLKQIEEDF